MKQSEKLFVAGAVVLALAFGTGTAIADQSTKSNNTSKRQPAKPSVWQTWRNEMRAMIQSHINTANYIRGSGSPEFK